MRDTRRATRALDVVGGERVIAVRCAVQCALFIAELPAERRGLGIVEVIVAHRVPASAVDAQLEDAARAFRAELESRTTSLDALPDEIQQVIFGQLCNALDPRSAVDYSSASKGLREPLQRVGEGASKSPLQQLKEENAAAAALCLKMRVRSCKALREAKKIELYDKGLSATDLATLGKLTPVLPALKRLELVEESASAGPDGRQLVEGLGVGALPAVTFFELVNVRMGDAGASALAAALDRGALPPVSYTHLTLPTKA